jgi:UPF0755 protein
MDNFGKRPVNRFKVADQAPEKRPLGPVPQPSDPVTAAPQPIPEPTPPPTKKRKKKIILGLIFGLIMIILGSVAAVWFWYHAQLAPVDSTNANKVAIVIESGTTPTQIAESLESKEIIRSATAFLWYTRFEEVQNNLQAGTYRLSPSESTQEIVTHLVNGRVDTFDVTLYPGATLVDNTNTAESKKYDVTTALRRAGFTDEEIATGLAADYSSYDTTLFQGRPENEGLEGYIYGETYRLNSEAKVEDVLRASFDEYWNVIEQNNLVQKYQSQGLTLYQGITLASIIQRESGGDDKEQIAQVFYTRLGKGMPLGSDVTYQYAADKEGVERDINLESPYNTRIKTGLPPGPIAVPGSAALVAVANPAAGNYEYFLSGDDDITYFATTLQEHEKNIREHCQQKCQIL